MKHCTALGCPDISFMRGILFLKMQMQGKKRSKVGHLARLFNAADAFSGAKYTRKSKCQDTLESVHIAFRGSVLASKCVCRVGNARQRLNLVVCSKAV